METQISKIVKSNFQAFPSTPVLREMKRFEVDVNACQSLKPFTKTIVEAAMSSSRNPIVSETKNLEFLIMIIDRAVKRTGQNMTAEDKAATALLFEEDLMKQSFLNFTQREVQYALEYYVDRKFATDDKEVVFISSANFVKALNCYQSILRRAAFIEYNQKLTKMNEKPVMSEAEIMKMQVDLVNLHAKRWLADAENVQFDLNIHNRSHYDNLREYGIYRMSNENAYDLLEIMKNRYPSSNLENQKIQASIQAYRLYVYEFLVKPRKKLVVVNEKFEYQDI